MRRQADDAASRLLQRDRLAEIVGYRDGRHGRACRHADGGDGKGQRSYRPHSDF